MHPDIARVVDVTHDFFERHPGAIGAFLGRRESQRLSNILDALPRGTDANVALELDLSKSRHARAVLSLYRPEQDTCILGCLRCNGIDKAEHSRRAYDSDREVLVAARIQRALLQDLQTVNVPGVKISGRTLPSRTVDGDFFFSVEYGTSLDIAVGDVMGKGLAAALIAAEARARMLKVTVEQVTVEGSSVPPDVTDLVQGIHDRFIDELLSIERFIVFNYLRVVPGTDRLDFVECGLPPAILYRSTARECLFLKGDNAPVGFSRDWIYSYERVPFEAGDLLFLYTDGLSDVTSTMGEQFGVSRIAYFLAGHTREQPSDIIELLSKHIREFGTASGFRDDVTFVLVKRSDAAPDGNPLRRITVVRDGTPAAEFRDFCLSGYSSWSGVLDVRSNPRLDRFLAVVELSWAIMRECYSIESYEDLATSGSWSRFLAHDLESKAEVLESLERVDEGRFERSGELSRSIEVIVSLYGSWSCIEIRSPMVPASCDGAALIRNARHAEPIEAIEGWERQTLPCANAIFCPSLRGDSVFFVTG